MNNIKITQEALDKIVNNKATFVFTQNKDLVNHILKQQSKKDVLTKTLGICSSNLAFVKRLLLREDFSKEEILEFIVNCLADYKDINEIVKDNKKENK